MLQIWENDAQVFGPNVRDYIDDTIPTKMSIDFDSV